jgi:HK97 family phage prohead protease
MNMERQLRICELRASAEKEQENKLIGHAAVFGQVGDGYFFTEEIARGAFEVTLKDKREKFAIFNHNWDFPLASTEKGLVLKEDEEGLYTEIEPTATQYGKDLIENVRAGIVKKMSFGFEIIREEYQSPKEKDDIPHFIIREVKLYEVSPVVLPFYDGTDLSLAGKMASRSAILLGEPPRDRSQEWMQRMQTSLEERMRKAGADKNQVQTTLRALHEKRAREIEILQNFPA